MHKNPLMSSELSWLKFNARVLQEADDTTLSLRERIRFLGIYSNNRDEFFRVQVSELKRTFAHRNQKNNRNDRNHLRKILDQIHCIILKEQKDFNRIWKKIVDDLKKENIVLVNDRNLNDKQKTFVRNLFDKEICSSIVPIDLENLSQLPSFMDNHIFLGIVLKNNKRSSDQKFALIEIPTKHHSRFVHLPSVPGFQNIMLLEDLIRFNLSRLFSHLGCTHFEAHMFKVTRDAEINIDDEVSTTFIQKIEKGVENRCKAPAVRLLYDKRMNSELLQLLISKLNLFQGDSIIPGGYIRNFYDFLLFPATLPESKSEIQQFVHPVLKNSERIYDSIIQKDVLLHFPYHSFNSIVDLLREAAMDPDVKSIKITAYRLAPDSKICNALINAVRNGKQVHIILELRACFDEEANLKWKVKLEVEGIKVFVGFPKMKVHAKICVIQKENEGSLISYGFVGTGNLNEKTALYYTDHFLLTANQEIMSNINQIFRVLENPIPNWRTQLAQCKALLVSPINMRQSIFSGIRREIQLAKSGKPSQIIANLNSLSDEKIIRELYKAANAGVEIKLIIRGIFCAAIDQIESTCPIKAISIVDKYLEHSRIWMFHNGGDEEIFISSADWNTRNLDHRIEVAIPIKDESIKKELKHILQIKLNDNVKARWLGRKLSNQFVLSNRKKIRSQLSIYRYLKRKKG